MSQVLTRTLGVMAWVWVSRQEVSPRNDEGNPFLAREQAWE